MTLHSFGKNLMRGCGADFTNGGGASHLEAGCPSGGTGYAIIDVCVDTIHHDAEYATGWVAAA